MGWSSWTHWIVIGIVALLLFGNRLPEVARSIGRAINEFKRGIREVNDEVDAADEPATKPRGKLKPPAEDADDSDEDDIDRKEQRISRQRVKETTPSDS